MTHEQRIAGFIAYLKEQARLNPHMKKDYEKRIKIVQGPFSGYNQPPMRHGRQDGTSYADVKAEALADIEQQFWASQEAEQRMKEQNQ